MLINCPEDGNLNRFEVKNHRKRVKKGAILTLHCIPKSMVWQDTEPNRYHARENNWSTLYPHLYCYPTGMKLQQKNPKKAKILTFDRKTAEAAHVMPPRSGNKRIGI